MSRMTSKRLIVVALALLFIINVFSLTYHAEVKADITTSRSYISPSGDGSFYTEEYDFYTIWNAYSATADTYSTILTIGMAGARDEPTFFSRGGGFFFFFVFSPP